MQKREYVCVTEREQHGYNAWSFSAPPGLPTCSEDAKRRATAASPAGELQAAALDAGDHQELLVLLLSQTLQWISKLSTSRKGANTHLERLGPPRAQMPAAKVWRRERVPAVEGRFTPSAQQAMGEHRSPGVLSLPPLPAQEMCPKAERYSLQLRQLTNQEQPQATRHGSKHSNSSPPSCPLRAVKPQQPPEDWNF